MKIAVLADIHGNLTALEAVMNHAGELGIDHFIIAGDHISDCPHPDEVLSVISELRAWVIRGNREDYVLRTIDSTDTRWQDYRQMDSIVWTRDQLAPQSVNYIRRLPRQASIRINGLDAIRVVHGSTDDVYEHLYPHKEERLNEILDSMEEKVLVCGHTHKPWGKRIGGKLVLNPGAVGVAFNDETAAEYAVLSWRDGEWHVEHHRVKYDLAALEEDFQSKGLFDNGGVWSRLIVQSLKEGVNRNIEFIEMAQKLATEEGYSKDEFIHNDVWKAAEERWRY